jgi:hypothetical protein
MGSNIAHRVYTAHGLKELTLKVLMMVNSVTKNGTPKIVERLPIFIGKPLRSTF